MRGIDAVDVLDALSAPLRGKFDALVAVVLGAHRVHADSPYKRTLALGFADVGQKVGRGNVDGGVVGGCCGAVGESARDSAVVDMRCAGDVAQRAFEREGVGV